jgi:acetoin utilization deacetylase AcuC-like enzyme
MRRVGVSSDPACLDHQPPAWHPDSPDRLTSIIATLKAAGLWDKVVHLAPRRAADGDILRVHTSAYLEQIRSCGACELDPDTYLSAGSLDAALHAAGAVLAAVDQCR